MKTQDWISGMDTHLSRQAELFVADDARAENGGLGEAPNASVPLYIGCAGWSLASSVHDRFPSQGTHLERYARVLSAVEINSSFYRPHRADTYARWRDSVPEPFRFSVKMPRTITHQLRLQHAGSELKQFIEEVSYLRHKLGCLLVQLPPSLSFEPSVAIDFFGQLRSMTDTDIVCEPRDVSWATHDAQEMLDRWKIARVTADPPVVPLLASASYTETVYVRLHGAPAIYHSVYTEEQLTRLASDLASHVKLGRRVWCIFDNTASGAAVPNALFLLSSLHALMPKQDYHYKENQ